MTKLSVIEGIGPAYEEKLKACGVRSTEALLKKGCTRQGRKALASETGLNEKVILGWVNSADLFRIKGVGGEYAELLEQAGVDTVPELAQRNPENLFHKMQTTNEASKLVRQLPALSQVTNWVAQAKTLERVIQH